MPLAAAWVLPFSRGGFASVSREVDSVFGRSVGRSVCGPEEAKRRGALTLNAISPLLSLKRPDRPRGKKEEKKGHSPGRKGGGGPQRMDPREGEGGDTEKIPTWFCVRLPRGGGGCEQTESGGGGGVEIPPVSCISTLSCWRFVIFSFSGKNVVKIGVF